jgi:hypothetical protein
MRYQRFRQDNDKKKYFPFKSSGISTQRIIEIPRYFLNENIFLKYLIFLFVPKFCISTKILFVIKYFNCNKF